MVYFQHLVDEPRPWLRPIGKVYDANRVSGEFYYRPMVDYLDWKDNSGLESGALLVSERREIHLPSALEMSKANQSCLGSGAPDYVAFLAKFFAKQMGEINTRKAKVGFALTRWDTDPNTIPYQKRTSEMIRDGYIDEVKNMKKSSEYAKLIEKKQYVSRKRDANLIKFVYERHPTSSISLDFYKPNMRSKIIRV